MTAAANISAVKSQIDKEHVKAVSQVSMVAEH